MGLSKLPAGVPGDNQPKGETDAAAFAPTEMAAPRFADEPPKADRGFFARAMRKGHARALEFEDDMENDIVRAQRRAPSSAKTLSIMIAIVALVGALGAALFITGRNKTPLCSSQPEWNQYNCRAG